ncbi:MAG: HlyD family efflux transporter periplasmic adaptor subunit [Hyphomicrobiales bacterium]|nr:HlyD family efflux transporter periplasmic adaptor subunit [Hyphomicrobiales bacterium]MBV9906256.1 HlyD family efflux transporter periplasmic adaptor subunit [Hyphomicrobiales bacterium]
MTQAKPVSGRDPAQEDAPPASSPTAPQPAQPLPFTPAKGAAQQPAARESAPQTPSGQPPSQPIQFTPARTPAPAPQAPPSAPPPPAPTPIVVKPKRRVSRFVMLVVIPLAALALGFTWWLSSGRYVSTDNAYVGADKSMITPQVTGAIVAVHVVEGQKVKVGDPLFDIDPKPYEIALALAKGKLEASKVEFSNLQSTFTSNIDQIKMGEDAVKVRQADFDRKNDLANSRSGTYADRDTSMANLIQAKQILEFVKWQQGTVKVKLGGGPSTSIDQFPDYMQASAAVDDAERNLRNTKVLAPIDGIATQVPEIELGRVAAAGQPVFAVVADTGLWVDANPKESDLTYVHVGLPATMSVDTFPGREWKGTVCSIAPGTGAQFAILPPQNASGNWVKVVQRVPLRFCFDPKEDTTGLRAGMSAYVTVDTGRIRTLSGVLDGLKQWVVGYVDTLMGARTAVIR